MSKSGKFSWYYFSSPQSFYPLEWGPGRGIDQNSPRAVLTLRAPSLRCGVKTLPWGEFFEP